MAPCCRPREENSKLKKIVADLSLDKEMLQDLIRRKL
jgi:putative transposase